MCAPVSQSVCLSFFIFCLLALLADVLASFCLSVSPSICLSLCLFVCLSFFLYCLLALLADVLASVCLSICLSVLLYSSVCLTPCVCLTIYLALLVQFLAPSLSVDGGIILLCIGLAPSASGD